MQGRGWQIRDRRGLSPGREIAKTRLEETVPHNHLSHLTISQTQPRQDHWWAVGPGQVDLTLNHGVEVRTLYY